MKVKKIITELTSIIKDLDETDYPKERADGHDCYGCCGCCSDWSDFTDAVSHRLKDVLEEIQGKIN